MNYEKTIILRLSKKDYDALKSKSVKKGVSLSVYVRAKLIKKVKHGQKDAEAV